jgi:uncharacterized protein YcfJ
MHHCIASAGGTTALDSAKAASFMDFSLSNIQAWNVLILPKLAEPGVQHIDALADEQEQKTGGKPGIHPMAKENVMKFPILIAASVLYASPLWAQMPAAAGPAVNEESAHYGWAAVLRVDPVYDEQAAAAAVTTAAPQQECWEEQVPVGAGSSADIGSGRRTVATMIGAVVGGLLGNQVGKGDGRSAATVAGVVAGGIVGNQVATERPQYTTQRRCRPKMSGVGAAGARHVVGYDVEYRYRGEVFTSRLAYDPGDRMRVKVSVTPAE